LDPPPFNFGSINDQTDRDVILSVCAYVVTELITGLYKYIEIDGYDQKENAWVVSFYQVQNKINSLDVVNMLDLFKRYRELSGCVILTECKLEQWSTATFCGKRLMGCFRLWIRPMPIADAKAELLAHKPVVQDNYVSPTGLDAHSTASERSDRHMRAARVGISKTKSSKPTRKEVAMAIAKRRNIFMRLVESVAGVSQSDVDATIDRAYDRYGT